jgi:hypothetical protein
MQFTRPATWDDVKVIARYFAAAGVEYALIGGYAVAAHGFNRFSEDIDVVVNPSFRKLSALDRRTRARRKEPLASCSISLTSSQTKGSTPCE